MILIDNLGGTDMNLNNDLKGISYISVGLK